MNAAHRSLVSAVVAFALPIFVFTAFLPARTAHAQNDDKKQPINYSANSGDVNYQTKIGNLSGNVVITQGTMTIRADRVVFKQNPDNSVSATAYGNPITFRQKREGVDEYFEGYAQRAEYDGEKTLLELFDRALLKRGQDEIRSNYISYNTRTELFRAEGRPDAPATPQDAGPGARVRGVFQPKSEGKEGDAKSNGSAGEKSADKAAPLPLKRAGELKSGAAK
jgi:lipopolysaccharide export system protein LptA